MDNDGINRADGWIDEQVYHDADYITPQDATRINNYYTPRCNLKDPCK